MIHPCCTLEITVQTITLFLFFLMMMMMMMMMFCALENLKKKEMLLVTD